MSPFGAAVQPHSKTLRHFEALRESDRFWSAAVLCRFGLKPCGVTGSSIAPLAQITLTDFEGWLCCAPLLIGDTNTMAKLSVCGLNVRDKRVFVRVDYNVPLE